MESKNEYQNRIVNAWLQRNVSDRTMQEAIKILESGRV